MVTQTGKTRLQCTPVWQCSYCEKKYQTKGQALSHEHNIHKKGEKNGSA